MLRSFKQGNNSNLTETAETFYQLNAKEDIRLQCLAHEDYYMFKIMTENKMAQLYAFDGWFDQPGGEESPLAEAILDRIKHDSYKINIIPTDPANYRSVRDVYGLDPALSE